MLPLLLLAASTLLLSGCFTGKRPSFRTEKFEQGTPTGDPAIDAVLARLDAATSSPPTFSATYDIFTKFGMAHHPTTVTVSGSRRVVHVDDVRYTQGPSQDQTCRASACSTGIDPAAISNTQVTIDFYAADAAKRLRLDATAKIGPTVASTKTIAGQPASCVDVKQADNTATYCVLANGVLAELDDADVSVTMQSYSANVDETALD